MPNKFYFYHTRPFPLEESTRYRYYISKEPPIYARKGYSLLFTFGIVLNNKRFNLKIDLHNKDITFTYSFT